jgi:type IX secretion system PorP/SprF family membrane protein
MRNILLYVSLVLLSEQSLHAQQEPFVSQFWESYNYLNPAQAGMQRIHNITALGRLQWDKLMNGPNYFLGSYAAQVKKLKGGVGVSYMREAIGNIADSAYALRGDKLKLSYNFQIPLNEGNKLSFGVSGGFNRKEIFASVIDSLEALKGIGFTADAGIAFTGKKLNAGISVTQLTSSQILDNYREKPHLASYVDYLFGDREKLAIETHVLFQTDFVASKIDLNVLTQYKQKAFLGISYHTSGAVSFVAGWDFIKKIRLAYSYDYFYNLDPINELLNVAHEVQLGFRF